MENLRKGPVATRTAGCWTLHHNYAGSRLQPTDAASRPESEPLVLLQTETSELASGRMFWFTRKKLSGSYFALIRANLE